MSLRITLKPGEKIFIGGAVVQNGDSAADFSILNDTPLLREKDILTEDKADSVCKRIYLCVQLMYIDVANITKYQQTYRRLLEEVIAAAPSTVDYLATINTDLACGRYYQALKGARKLVDYEQELIDHARQSA
ncbi:flagellar protein FlbT [Parasulfuritortus cantonensis]|uniref:Flagellar protein FlbT n=1 Tax=Parasulfuritortus cantonensis TaxID=2528202 RepID=A0A4R1BKT6_9PROT|nr:flagellar biosynthesis repressor FlbT [Parasulfuritortus cantonensis]TCJ17954.1 flagellar protein FlbT [Parasulfuritortus cantonensis]